MKNIHIIATPNPSRLSFINDKLYFDKDEEHTTSSSQNIYITNDEEIKVGDYMINMLNCIYLVDKEWMRTLRGFKTEEYRKKWQKIILTTDQDLIKDGVQAIDDEFLQWFVNNPSCESVIVTNLYGDFKPFKYDYKIIIPQEEAKQETFEDNKQARLVKELANELKSKQETLEEAETVEEYFLSNIKNMLQFNNDALAIRFMEKYYHAKQQQQKNLYSEEEVNELLNLLKQSIKEINHIKFTYKDKGHCVKYLSDCESIIEQFKKK